MAASNSYQEAGGQASDGRQRPLVQATPLEADAPQGPPPPVGSPGPVAAARPQPTVGGAPGRPAPAQPVPVQRPSGTTVQPRSEEPEGEDEFSSLAIRNAPPWLISTVFHMVLLIILGLLVMSMPDASQIRLEFEPVVIDKYQPEARTY